MKLLNSFDVKLGVMKLPLSFLLLFFLGTYASAQQAENVELFAHAHRGDVRYSGSWSYIAADGSEYALLGARTGTAIYPIDDPQNMNEICFISGPETNWREITTLGDYAYIVTDAQGTGHSLQVLDLSGLPYSADLIAEYSATFTKSHIIQRDLYNDDPYIYAIGDSETFGVHIIDVTDPYEPYEAGFYNPDYYIHDCFVKGDLMYACAFYESKIDVVDISDKSNPVLITQIEDNGGNTHSAFVTEDNTHMIVCSELDGLPARIYNIEDLEDVHEVSRFTANSQSLVHNPYIKDNFVYFSHNTEGLRVVDIADPSVPVEVGYFDTYNGPSGGSNGLWSACPYLDSGKVIGGNREDGLYVWNVERILAGRFYGQVRDSVTNAPIFNASIIIVENSDTLFSDFSGKFKAGALPGLYTLLVNAAGYKGKLVHFAISEGDSLDLDVVLAPLTTSTQNLNKDLPKLTNYPNPFLTATNIDLSDFPTARTIKIFAIDGKQVLEQKVNGAQTIHLDRTHLSAGNYWYQILDDRDQAIARGELTAQ